MGAEVNHHLQAAWAAGRMAADQIEQAERAMNAKPELKALEDFLEGEAGCRYHTAMILFELQVAAETAHQEFQHDPDFSPEVLAACKLICDFEFKV